MSLPDFPPEALQVLRIIREEVPRPDELPQKLGALGTLRWDHSGYPRCPMGLHKNSSSEIPHCRSLFAGGCCPNSSVIAFLRWWDILELNQAQVAMDFIWPERKPKTPLKGGD